MVQKTRVSSTKRVICIHVFIHNMTTQPTIDGFISQIYKIPTAPVINAIATISAVPTVLILIITAINIIIYNSLKFYLRRSTNY